MCDLHKVPNGPLFQVRSIEDAFTGICYGSSLSLTLVLSLSAAFSFPMKSIILGSLYEHAREDHV